LHVLQVIAEQIPKGSTPCSAWLQNSRFNIVLEKPESEKERLRQIEKRFAKSKIPLKNLIDFPRFLMFFFA
jgi:hypothetical protein